MRQYTSADKYLYSGQIVAGFEERFIIILSITSGGSGIGLMKLASVGPGCSKVVQRYPLDEPLSGGSRHTFCYHLSVGQHYPPFIQLGPGLKKARKDVVCLVKSMGQKEKEKENSPRQGIKLWTFAFCPPMLFPELLITLL